MISKTTKIFFPRIPYVLFIFLTSCSTIVIDGRLIRAHKYMFEGDCHEAVLLMRSAQEKAGNQPLSKKNGSIINEIKTQCLAKNDNYIDMSLHTTPFTVKDFRGLTYFEKDIKREEDIKQKLIDFLSKDLKKITKKVIKILQTKKGELETTSAYKKSLSDKLKGDYYYDFNITGLEYDADNSRMILRGFQTGTHVFDGDLVSSNRKLNDLDIMDKLIYIEVDNKTHEGSYVGVNSVGMKVDVLDVYSQEVFIVCLADHNLSEYNLDKKLSINEGKSHDIYAWKGKFNIRMPPDEARAVKNEGVGARVIFSFDFNKFDTRDRSGTYSRPKLSDPVDYTFQRRSIGAQLNSLTFFTKKNKKIISQIIFDSLPRQ